jgi:preprotein translocase subunit SecG
MAERPDLINENNSTTFDYDNYILSMVEDGQLTENSSASDDNVKTDYRLSLPSSSQIQTYHLNINTNISERRKKFLSRIITIVAIFLLVVCILLVTLTLRLAHKIDELVRRKQLMPKPNTFLLISSTTTTPPPTTTTATNNFIHRRRTQSSIIN